MGEFRGPVELNIDQIARLDAKIGARTFKDRGGFLAVLDGFHCPSDWVCNASAARLWRILCGQTVADCHDHEYQPVITGRPSAKVHGKWPDSSTQASQFNCNTFRRESVLKMKRTKTPVSPNRV